ncbi:PREDICTED: uncharacterized protein LOC108745691 [Trachymyrmex septentrionalis]|uniref:uncharacterized protein LOC108745691 n=1 Tax=Trachymyrmex septentrionalis TaxID=34720 RepID=UPI00084F17A4|nr:PREDICTED: uncharacterized protein LOC108745691 [Trachymyrmex septentrionalis]
MLCGMEEIIFFYKHYCNMAMKFVIAAIPARYETNNDLHETRRGKRFSLDKMRSARPTASGTLIFLLSTVIPADKPHLSTVRRKVGKRRKKLSLAGTRTRDLSFRVLLISYITRTSLQ